MKNAVNGRLISCALLSLNRRHTCGMNPTVVKAPPMNPSSSCHSKVCFLLVGCDSLSVAAQPLVLPPIMLFAAQKRAFSAHSWQVFSHRTVRMSLVRPETFPPRAGRQHRTQTTVTSDAIIKDTASAEQRRQSVREDQGTTNTPVSARNLKSQL